MHPNLPMARREKGDKERGVAVQGGSSSGDGWWPPMVSKSGERERKDRASAGAEKESRKYVGLRLGFWKEV